MADEVKKTLNAAGIKEVLFEAYTPGERDYSSLISRVKQADADVLFIGGYHTETGLIARQLKEQGAAIQIVGGDALVTDELWSIAGPAAEGLLMTFGPDPRNRPSAKVAMDDLRKAKFEPEGYTLYTYAAIQAVADGIKLPRNTTHCLSQPLYDKRRPTPFWVHCISMPKAMSTARPMSCIAGMTANTNRWSNTCVFYILVLQQFYWRLFPPLPISISPPSDR